MSNPMLDFIDLVDKYGTQVSSYGVDFTGSLLTQIYRVPTELLVLFVQVVLTYAIWIVDLIINRGLFLGVAGSVYQSLLDSVYQYVNPLIIAMLAFMVLVTRMFVGDKVTKKEKEGRITGFQMNYATLGGDEAFRKKLTSQIMNTALLMFIIMVAMANPFTLLTKAFSVITWTVARMAPETTGASPQVDGVLAPMLQLINYQDVLSPACGESWSRTLSGGGNVAKLSCLTAPEEAATTAGPVTVLLAVMSIVMVAGFIYFSWVILMRFTWMLYKTIANVAIVPWQAAMLIANPGNERQKLDTVKDRFLDAGKGLFWLIVTVFAASAVPAALLTALAKMDFPPLVSMLISSVGFYAAGKAANKTIGRKYKRDKEGNRTEILDGTTGWNDFRTKGGMGEWLAQPFNDAQKASKAQLELSESIITGTSTSTKSQSAVQKGTKVDEATKDPDLDAAVQLVDLTTKQPVTVVDTAAGKVGTAAAVAAAAAAATSIPSDTAAGSSAKDIAAAATAAVVAGADTRNGSPSATPDMEWAAGGPFGDLGVSPQQAGVAMAATAFGGAAAGAALMGSEDGGGRHHRGTGKTLIEAFGDTNTSAAPAPLVPVDPEAQRRESIASYRGAIEQISVDPDAIDDQVIAVAAARPIESTAFHRVAKVFNETVEPGETEPTTRGVVAGSGEFQSVTTGHVEWEQYKTLAKTMGMEIEPPKNDDAEKRPNITFYSSTDDGKNEIRFRGRDGFGDSI